MGTEIERKFIVVDEAWRAGVTSSQRMRQGYLCVEPARTVRVRLAGAHAWLTIKGASVGVTRAEFEYAIPPGEALELLDRLCRTPQIDKTRHLVPYGGLEFEVDVFHGENEGLVIAEVELDAADTHVELPPWIGDEVTGDPRYYNASLVQHPYASWHGAG